MIIGTNFKLSSAKFLDDRQLCKDYATLIANVEGIIYPPGFEVFCEYENKYYQYVSDTNGGYVWEERKSGVSDGISASIKDDTISEEYTWSSAHIDSMRIDLETLITQANDYVDEIDERMLFIEGKFQWFEYFDGSYNSLTDKPIIPTKLSELENDSEFLGIERLELELESVNEKIDTKIDKEEDRTLISVTELERLSTVDNYNDTEVRQSIEELETQAHTHINSDILNTITEEKINQWDNNTGVDDYNYIQNKPITRVGDDSDILLNFGQIIDEGMYIVTAMVGEYKIHNELVHVKWADDDNVTLTIPNMFMVLNANRTDGVWTIVNELHYGVDKENGKISDTLTIGEDKIILDKEGNGWFEGKVSQEGTPTEDKDLVTKGYVDNKFATNERVSAIEKENARRDVIIEALANGRRRTVETDGNDVDLMFSTEKDKVWIDKIEGDTMVNVCDQEEPIAITKSYTVEGTNHVPLQGEYDGKARPVVHGNTLVNHNVEYDKSVITGEKLDNTHGTEILNLEGTPGCEIKVDIDGHTAINLSTKKEDILCKSFDSASGNEINLVAEENSVSDLVIQGNTMVNIFPTIPLGTDNKNTSITGTKVKMSASMDSHAQLRLYPSEMPVLQSSRTYTMVVDIEENTLDVMFNIVNSYENYFISDRTCNVPSGYTGRFVTTFNTVDDFTDRVFCMQVPRGTEGTYVLLNNIMIFEGDLTQTPELIPTEYVEGLQSTFEDKLIPYSIYNGNNLTSITETQYQLPLTVEVGKTYTITTTANVGTTENHKYQYGVYSADGLTNYLEYESCSPTQTFVCDKANILFKVRMYPSYSGDDYSFVLDEVKDKFLIVEGDWTDRLDLLTEEYFGKYRVDMSSVGKNLIIPTWEKGVFMESNGYLNTNGVAAANISFIKVTPKKVYTFNSFDTDNIRIFYYNINKKFISHILIDMSTKTNSFTIPSNVYYLRFHVATENINSIQLQLEEGTQATEYEPYHGSTKTIYLNSPLLNGDELVMKDGKLCHYHKMGKVVLDGSEDWTYRTHTTGMARFDMLFDTIKAGSQDYCISDKFKTYDVNNSNAQDVEGKILEYIASHSVDGKIIIVIDALKLSTTDANGFKQWLSENPTTVVYELAEPWYEEIGAYGKVVLDGSEEWIQARTQYSNTYSAYIHIKNGTKTSKLISENYLVSPEFEFDSQGIYNNGSNASDAQVICRVLKGNLSDVSLNGFKQYLQSNPITVIYELAEPQHIDEDMRFNISTNSTIEYQSSVPMANTQFLPYRNELPLLESSTQYRVTFDCDVEGIELMVSLGGTSQTITSALHNELSFITPSLQTDGKLTIDGYGMAKIDNVLITKGDMEYKYFEGLKSGFEYRYIPVDITKDFEKLIVDKGVEGVVDAPISNIKPNTKYTVYAPVLEGNYIALRFRIPNGGELSTTINSNIPFTNPMIIETYDDTYDFSNVILRYYCDLERGTSFSTKDIKVFEGDWSHLTEYLNELSEEDWNNSEIYKATIRIQNPNAPIFGKGGRL